MSSPLTPVMAGSPLLAMNVATSFCLKSPPISEISTPLPDTLPLIPSRTVVLRPLGQIQRASFFVVVEAGAPGAQAARTARPSPPIPAARNVRRVVWGIIYSQSGWLDGADVMTTASCSMRKS